MPNTFNQKIDKITEREVVFDFLSRLSFGYSHDIGDLYSTYINQDGSSFISVSQNNSSIEYQLSDVKLIDFLVSLSLMPNIFSSIGSINKSLRCKIVNIEGVKDGIGNDNAKIMYGSPEYIPPYIRLQPTNVLVSVYLTSNPSIDLKDFIEKETVSQSIVEYKLHMESNFVEDDSLVFIYY